MIGETLGNYRVMAKIGEGGMGAVYLAEHPLLGRKAAIKMLRPEYSNNQDAVARFFREARATANLRHPALVDVFDYGVHTSGNAYIVMDYLEGESLEQRVTHTALPLAQSLEIGRQIAAGLAVAHATGIVHRDLKPGNVFLTPDPQRRQGEIVKILDFGIAKLINHAAGPGESTGTNVVMGTPLYMAPEQCAGARGVDHRADIYALGCVLYRMVCGRPPFEYEWPGELIAAHLREEPVAPRSHDSSIPPLVESIILKALSKNPAQRFQTLGELAQELELASASEPPGQSVPPMTDPWTRQGFPTPGSGTLAAPLDPFGDSSRQLVDKGDPWPSRGEGARKPLRAPGRRAILVAGGALAVLAASGAWIGLSTPEGEKPPATEATASFALVTPPTPTAPADPTAATALAVVAPTEGVPARDELAESERAGAEVPRPDQPATPAREPGTSPGSAADPMPTTIRIGINNGRRGLNVKVDGRAVPLPLRLPRDMQMHELLFETPNFRPEKRRLRADRDQSIVLDNKPGFFVP